MVSFTVFFSSKSAWFIHPRAPNTIQFHLLFPCFFMIYQSSKKKKIVAQPSYTQLEVSMRPNFELTIEPLRRKQKIALFQNYEDIKSSFSYVLRYSIIFFLWRRFYSGYYAKNLPVDNKFTTDLQGNDVGRAYKSSLHINLASYLNMIDIQDLGVRCYTCSLIL